MDDRPFGVAHNRLGTASFIAGLIGLATAITVVGGAVFGVVAVVLALFARRRLARQQANNRATTTAGLVTGVVAVAASLFLALGLSPLRGSGGQTLSRCMQQAGGRQSQVTECRQKYGDLHS